MRPTGADIGESCLSQVTCYACHFSIQTAVHTKCWQSRLNEEKENRRWTTMDDDAFRFGTLTQPAKGQLRVGRFLSASMVVYLRFNCRF